MFTHNSYADVYLKNHHQHHFAKKGSQLDLGAARSTEPYTKQAPIAIMLLDAVSRLPQTNLSHTNLSQTSLPKYGTEQGLSALLTQQQAPSALFNQALVKQSPEHAIISQAVQTYTSVSMLPSVATSAALCNLPWPANLATIPLATSAPSPAKAPKAAGKTASAAIKLNQLMSGSSAALAAVSIASQDYPNVSVRFTTTTTDNTGMCQASTMVAAQTAESLCIPLASGHLLSPAIYNPLLMQAHSSINVASAYLAHLASRSKTYSLRAPLAKRFLAAASNTAASAPKGAGASKGLMHADWCCHQNTSAYASTLARTLYGVRSLSITYAAQPLPTPIVHDLKLAPLCRLLGAAYPYEDPVLATQLVAVDLQNFAQAKTTDLPNNRCGSLGHLQHAYRSSFNQKQVLSRAQLGLSGGISFRSEYSLAVTECNGATRSQASYVYAAQLFESAFSQEHLSDAQPARTHLTSAEAFSDHHSVEAADRRCPEHDQSCSYGGSLQANVHRADDDAPLNRFSVAKTLAPLLEICCVELNPLDQVLRCLLQRNSVWALSPLILTSPVTAPDSRR